MGVLGMEIPPPASPEAMGGSGEPPKGGWGLPGAPRQKGPWTLRLGNKAGQAGGNRMQWAEPALGSGGWSSNPVFPLSSCGISGFCFSVCEMARASPSTGS